MKKLIVQNIVNLLLGILIACFYFFFDLQICLAMGVIWLVYLIWSNYSILSRNAVTSLEDADKAGLFKGEIKVLDMIRQSIEIKRELFMTYDETDSYRQAFELIDSKFNSIIASATKFLQHYDYVRRPDARYFKKLVTEAHNLAQKLDELSNLVIQIDNTANSIDSTYVDDIIESLRSVNSDD